jgi:SsrA-binding protein
MPKNLNKMVVARNRRARYDYEVSKTFVAGIVLRGYEVKSAKSGQVNLRDSYVRIERGEAWLINTHIALWKFSQVKDYDPKGRRKLLLAKKEIKELQIAQDAKKMVLIPLEMFIEGRKLKLKIGVGRGRKKFDKRAKVKEREMKRQLKEDLAKVREF